MLGRFGPYGGQYVAETLMPAIAELEAAWRAARADAALLGRGRRAARRLRRPAVAALSRAAAVGGASARDVYLKREDLNHTGAHKINNCIGQAVLARRMGKRRLIAETGAGQHGVATATVAALFGLPCEIYMGAEDVVRQALNVERMKLLGAQVHPVTSGTRTLKDAMNEALRDWVTNVGDTFYLIGSVAGPHPYPWLVRDLQSVIGREARAQILARDRPAARRARRVRRRRLERGRACSRRSSATPACSSSASRRRARASRPGATPRRSAPGRVGVLHGSKSYVLVDARRPDRARALDQRRPRLSGRRPRARALEGDRRA